ncbi:ankyrin repeat protein [Saudi moumouvirus]|nr:ankyrin repeat protein [Saudi moumouvirus]
MKNIYWNKVQNFHIWKCLINYKKFELNIIVNKLSFVNLLIKMSSKLYFKITNDDECHHGFQYKDGLNVLKGEFNNSQDSCVPGRLYFSDPENILKFLNYGIYLREVFLPIDNPDFKMIKDPDGDKYGANMIILGKRRDLRDPETWKYMISIGVDIYAKNYALKWASNNVHFEIFKYLIENGINIHSDNNNLLGLACRDGHLEIVKYLVKKGADIHVNDDYTLRLACEYGHLKIVKYLVKKGANIFSKNNDPLRKALEKRNLEVATFLVEKGARVYAKSDIIRLVSYFGNYELVKCLMHFEIDPEDGECVLKCASSSGELEVVKYLVENGIDIHADNDSALALASDRGHLEVVKYLVESGANIHADKDYALRWASRCGYLDVVQYLVENGANINAKNDYSLRWASENGHLEVVKYLESLS